MKPLRVVAEVPLRKALRQSLVLGHQTVHAGGRRLHVARLKTFAIHGCTCVRCGRKGDRIIAWEDHGGGLHVDLFSKTKSGDLMLMNRDHILPKSKGGPETIWNLQPMCCKCNTRKANVQTAEDKRVLKFRQRWKDIHNHYMSKIFRWLPECVRFGPVVNLVRSFRDLHLYKVTWVIAKFSA